MNQVTQDPPEPILLTVVTITGEIWKLGKTPPQLQNPPDAGMAATEITRMVRVPDGSVRAYAYPHKDTELDRAKSALEFTIPSMTVRLVITVARFDVLKMLEDIAVGESLGDDDDDQIDCPACGVEVPHLVHCGACGAKLPEEEEETAVPTNGTAPIVVPVVAPS